MGWIFVPQAPSKERKSFDWIGYILLLISVYCLVTAITEGNREGWTSSHILGLFLVGIMAGATLIWTQLQDWSTLIDLSLFRHKQFAMTALIAFVFGVGNFGTGYGVPVFGQLIQGMTPIVAALMMLPSALLIVVTLPFTGKLADSIPAHIGILIGLFLFAIGTIPMGGADVNTPFLLITLYFIVSRMGMSFTNPFIMSTALRSLPPEQLSAGGGMINFCRQFGVRWALPLGWLLSNSERSSMATRSPRPERRQFDDAGTDAGRLAALHRGRPTARSTCARRPPLPKRCRACPG